MIIVEKEVNAVTGEETITEREETEAEKKERLHYENILATQQAEAATKEAARLAAEQKLAALGLTKEDLTALGL